MSENASKWVGFLYRQQNFRIKSFEYIFNVKHELSKTVSKFQYKYIFKCVTFSSKFSDLHGNHCLVMLHHCLPFILPLSRGRAQSVSSMTTPFSTPIMPLHSMPALGNTLRPPLHRGTQLKSAKFALWLSVAAAIPAQGARRASGLMCKSLWRAPPTRPRLIRRGLHNHL